jgi:hypothetical protein
MFGMGKEKSSNFFQFDLEKEITDDPNKKKSLLAEIQTKMSDLKTVMKDDLESEAFEEYGVLLQGYTALEKTIKNMGK